MKKIFISTMPFGEVAKKPLELLDSNKNIEYVFNPYNRRLKENELFELISDYDGIIAGTEPITRKVMENAPKLKLIARVGIGLDSVDLLAARELGITVTYTPDAPSPAVAELTIGHMINLLRDLPTNDRTLRQGKWNRFTGERISCSTIGIIGVGRIGSRVLKHLSGFEPKKILVNDLKPDMDLYSKYNAVHVDKDTIFAESDIITFHLPLTKLTRNLIKKTELEKMKSNVYLINTSRGVIINENDLLPALESKRIRGAALDVFKSEPYTGPLLKLDNCIFSCHLGSMTKDCRGRMELEATEEVIRFANNEPYKSLVPEDEYLNCQ